KTMNLKAILQAIGAEIKKIFSSTEKELETVILPIVIEVTNGLKTLVDGDSNDLVGSLIAGKAGAVGEDKLRAALAAVVPKLQMAQSFLLASDASADPSIVLAQVIKIAGAA